MSRKLIEKIEKLIETERAALLSGDFEVLSQLADEKLSIATGLENIDPSIAQHDLHRLRTMSDHLSRNEQLLSRAIAGVRDVTDRLRRQTEAQTRLHTYGQDGRPDTITTNTPRHTFRA